MGQKGEEGLALIVHKDTDFLSISECLLLHHLELSLGLRRKRAKDESTACQI